MGLKKINLFVLLYLLFAGLTLTVEAQIDTTTIYKNARFVPRVKAKNVESLATSLAKSCSSEEEIVLAFSYWICKNIRFDYSEYEKRPAENKTMKKVLRSRKALSDGYVRLFVEMCKSQKITALYVPGYSKEFDFLPSDTLIRADYAWALVRLSGKWYIMDLTNASCKIVARVSPFSKVLWKTFHIPYASHLMAVKDYNLKYLYVNPSENLKRYMPVADVFQLMKYPMAMSYYVKGDSTISSYIEKYPDVKQISSDLDNFTNLSATEKYIYVADRSEVTNSNNQYTKAQYYYFALKNFFNTYYIESKGRIFAPLEESQKAWEYSQMADSLFFVATQNNNDEFSAKQVRSENWKKDLIENNKLLAQKFNTQAKVNMQQVRMIGKINSQNKKIQAYISKQRNKYALRDIIDLNRPMIQNKEYLEQGTEKINTCYDKMDKCAALLADFDSLISPIKSQIVDSVYQQQRNASDLCNKELASLSRYLDKKGSNLSLVYYSSKYITKKPFFDVFEQVGDINDKNTDPMIEIMSERIPQLYEIVQLYVNETVASLNLLKEAKGLLANDFGEDDMYEKIALKFNAQLQTFSKQFDNIMKFSDNLSKCLDGDVTIYKDMVKMLQNDNSMENYRHKEYMDYRKSIKQAENDKIRYYQGTIKNYKKLIGRAIDVK